MEYRVTNKGLLAGLKDGLYIDGSVFVDGDTLTLVKSLSLHGEGWLKSQVESGFIEKKAGPENKKAEESEARLESRQKQKQKFKDPD